MSIIPTPHRSWCDQDRCYTRQDGRAVHVSAEEGFHDRGMVTVRLVEVACADCHGTRRVMHEPLPDDPLDAVRPFDPARDSEGDASVCLSCGPDGGNGIEVQLEAGGTFVVTDVTLIPETAAELGEALIDHAERAQGLSRPAQ